MADALGTYYGPSERGLATVLPQGPNLMGYAMQQQQLQARRDAIAEQRRAREESDRQRMLERVSADISKPVPTAFPYQESVNSMKEDLLKDAENGFLNNEDPAAIRFRIANGIQKMVGYANAGKQVYETIGQQVRGLDKKVYRTDEIARGLTEKIIGPDGGVLDPQDVDPRDINAADFVYSSDRPWQYLNENEVTNRFLKNPAFQQVVSEIQRDVDAKKVGRFTRVGTETGINKFTGGLYSINPVSGDITVNDPATLVENGVFQMAMNDRDMAAVLRGDVESLLGGRKVDQRTEDLLMASALQDRLTKSAPGPQTVERVSSRYLVTNAAARSGRTKSEIDAELDARHMNLFKSHISSDDPKLVQQGLEYLNIQLGISDDARTALEEAINAPSGYSLRGVEYADNKTAMPKELRTNLGFSTTKDYKGPGMYAKFTNGSGKVLYRFLDKQKLVSEFGSQVYSTAFKRTERRYLEELDGGTAPAAPQASPGKKTIEGF